MPLAEKEFIWRHYGWFTGLICCGCCVAVVSYYAYAQFLVSYYSSEVSPRFGAASDLDAAAAASLVSGEDADAHNTLAV